LNKGFSGNYISTTLSGVISHAWLFATGQLWDPWQTLAEPLGTPVENHWPNFRDNNDLCKLDNEYLNDPLCKYVPFP